MKPINHSMNTRSSTLSKTADARLWDENGKSYIDFFSGAGAFSYEHADALQRPDNRQWHHALGVDMTDNNDFAKVFDEIILKPRNLQYTLSLPFAGSATCDTVETAIKFARRVKGRTKVVSFVNLLDDGSRDASVISENGNSHFVAGEKNSPGSLLPHVEYFETGADAISRLESALHGTEETPAAVVVETVQKDVRMASSAWLQAIEAYCKEHDMLLIVNENQVGCGRTGRFFSFEESGINPDIVTVMPSINNFGNPFPMLLIRTAIDTRLRGQRKHTSDNNRGVFLSATQALQYYWNNHDIENMVQYKGSMIEDWFQALAGKYPEIGFEMRGRGMIFGIKITSAYGLAIDELAMHGILQNIDLHNGIAQNAFRHGLLITTTGIGNDILKLMPPLLIEEGLLSQGLVILENQMINELAMALQRQPLVGHLQDAGNNRQLH